MGSRLRFLSILVTLISFSLAWTAPALAQSSETAQTEQSEQIDAQAMDLILRSARFLAEQNNLPDTPLTAGIPVNIRPADDEGTGTQISFMIASLALPTPQGASLSMFIISKAWYWAVQASSRLPA